MKHGIGRNMLKAVNLTCLFDFGLLGSCQEWPPALGALFNTSIFCWSFECESFWRGESVSMGEVVAYAKSMALTRFKEAWPGTL